MPQVVESHLILGNAIYGMELSPLHSFNDAPYQVMGNPDLEGYENRKLTYRVYIGSQPMGSGLSYRVPLRHWPSTGGSDKSSRARTDYVVCRDQGESVCSVCPKPWKGA